MIDNLVLLAYIFCFVLCNHIFRSLILLFVIDIIEILILDIVFYLYIVHLILVKKKQQEVSIIKAINLFFIIFNSFNCLYDFY